MICQKCSREFDDGLAACPYCGTAADGHGASSSFIFCEGCGARLSERDRTCPKCGRPAPGILSAEAAARDLAAGKTASFPRLSAAQIEAQGKRARVDRAADESFDSDATSSLSLDEIAKRSAPVPVAEDPYHDPEPRRRSRLKWVAALAVVAVAAAAFIAIDPLGVMPGVYASIERSASEMFPSRAGAASSAEDAGEESGAKGEDGAASGHEVASEPVELTDDAVLTDDEAYEVLLGLWERIGEHEDVLGDVIDDYNGCYIARDKAKREEASKSAYALRDTVQETIDEIDAVSLSHDSAYAEDLDHIRQLAGWMYNRVDVLCESWDISLSIPADERAADHQSEIARPLREALDATGRNQNLVQYQEHYAEWRPRQK